MGSDGRQPDVVCVYEGVSGSPRCTAALGRAMGEVLGVGAVVGLFGELGAGKTQFVRGLAAGLGADERGVSSPTYVLVHEYEPLGDGPALIHVDAYRLSSLWDLESIGWEQFADCAGGDGEMGAYGRVVVVVEWAERVVDQLPGARLEVRLEHAGESLRRVRVDAVGRWDDRMVKTMSESLNEVAKVQGEGVSGSPRVCPICKEAVGKESECFPFCSNRCKTIDLGRWAKGAYMISRPIEQADLEEGE